GEPDGGHCQETGWPTRHHSGRTGICLDENRQRSRSYELACAGPVLYHQAPVPPGPRHVSTRDRHLYESHRPTIPRTGPARVEGFGHGQSAHNTDDDSVNGHQLLHLSSRIFFSGLLLLSWGCVHRIHVSPVPPTVSPTAIAQSVQVVVPFLALEGADHRPGIILLEWPAQDLRTAAIDYIHARQTFASVGEQPADLTLIVKAWLMMRSQDNYYYRVHLESALGPSGKPPVKSYL